jgi:hypothetical protein
MHLAVFSICSNYGVPQAQLLLETVKQFLPGADRFLILADETHPAVHYPDGCEVVAARDLGIPDFINFAFRYDIMEFNAALKPFAFLHLLSARGYTHCLYFDPDIEVFNTLPALTEALDSNASFVLTPHILAPAEQGDCPDDIAIMRGGTFNLGFLGVSGTREAYDLLGWWARWLRTHCVDERPIGLFIDQKFMDLIPGLASGARILRDPGLNVAFWNISQRRLVPDAPAGPEVDGHPLVFFHYCGFDPASPDRLSTEIDLFQGGALPRSLQVFLAGYADRLRAAGYGRIPAGCYAYGRFTSGVPIPTIARRMFRDDYAAWAADPFATFEAWAHLPTRGAVAGIGSAVPSLMMQWLQARHPSPMRFALSDPAGSAHVTRWWLEHGSSIGVDRRFVEPQALAAGRRPVSVRASYPARRPDREDVSIIAPLDSDSPAGEIGRAQCSSLSLASGTVQVHDIQTSNPSVMRGRLLGFCVAPDQLAPVLVTVRPNVPKCAYRIFIPSAERMAISPACLDAFGEIDEIWAPTRFIQASFVLTTELPVLHMPVAWRFPPPPVAAGVVSPGRPYVLAEDDNFPGCGALRTALLAYQKACASWPSTRPPALVIHSGRSDEWDDTLRALIAANDGIVMPATADVATLITGAACLLSLHRGEALGLPILRAMAWGVPVVATDYGGCTDVLTPETGFPVDFRLRPTQDAAGLETAWAEADADHAAWSLRDVFDRPDLARRRAAAARARMETLCDPEAVAALQSRRLRMVERLAARPSRAVAA